MAARGVNITARNGAASSWTALRTSEPPPLRDVVLCRPQSRLFCPPSHPRISESQSSITNNRGAASFLSAWNHLQIDDVLTDLVNVVAAGPLLTRRRDCEDSAGGVKDWREKHIRKLLGDTAQIWANSHEVKPRISTKTSVIKPTNHPRVLYRSKTHEKWADVKDKESNIALTQFSFGTNVLAKLCFGESQSNNHSPQSFGQLVYKCIRKNIIWLFNC